MSSEATKDSLKQIASSAAAKTGASCYLHHHADDMDHATRIERYWINDTPKVMNARLVSNP